MQDNTIQQISIKKNKNFKKDVPSIEFDQVSNFLWDHIEPMSSLEFFVKMAFNELNPSQQYLDNWHIKLICSKLAEVFSQRNKRLIISMPPRYMKSIIVSTAFPAWCLGIDPTTKIIVASYSQVLANKLSLDTRKVIESEWYKRFYPKVNLTQSQTFKFCTEQNGFRFATSVMGSLTGEGADILIVDDPHKPNEVDSKLKRDNVINWYNQTFCSRLNNVKTGSIIIVMQRLHTDDLVGFLMEKAGQEWDILNFDAIATQSRLVKLDRGDMMMRSIGQPLHDVRQNVQALDKIRREMGEGVFSAQYQQNPQAGGGRFLKRSWLRYYSHAYDVQNTYFISIDAATKTSLQNDYTAITVWHATKDSQQYIYLADLVYKKMEYPDLVQNVYEIIKKYKPETIIIEDKSSGTQLIQDLKRRGVLNIKANQPKTSKELRLATVAIYFEEGLVHFSKTIQNLWEVEVQLLTFPSSKHDDIVDSVSMFLNWYYVVNKFAQNSQMQPMMRRV